MIPSDKDPSLSVVIPTHSRVDLYLETLTSLERQSVCSFELIVTDDSNLSSDRAAISKAASEFADRTGISTRYIFSEPALGQAKNTNQGLSKARCRFIRILHSDDQLAPRALEAEISLMSDPYLNLEFLFHYCVPFKNSPHFVSQPALMLIQPKHFFRNTMHSGTPLPSGVVFTADSLRAVGPMRPDMDFLCDWEFISRLIFHEHQCGRFLGALSKGFIGWRVHENSTTGRLWHRHFLEHEQFITDLSRNVETCAEFFPNKEAQDIFETQAVRYRYRRLLTDISGLGILRFIKEFPRVLRCAFSFRSLRDRLRPAPWTSIGRFFNSEIKSPIFQQQKQQVQLPSKTRNGLIATLSTVISNYIINKAKLWAARQQRHIINSEPNPFAFVNSSHSLNQGPKPLSAFKSLEIMSGFEPIRQATTTVRMIADYDNLLHLWPLRSLIANVEKVCVYETNANIFHERILHECLKYIRPETDIEFRLKDNVHLTCFGIKAEIDHLFPGQFSWCDQKKILSNNHVVRYRRRNAIHPAYSSPHTGWTFGMLASGKRLDNVNFFIDSIALNCPDPYEIIIVSSNEIDLPSLSNNVRLIQFRDHDDLGWITRKKNLICEQATFSDLLICHDRYWLDKNFFRKFAEWGYSYGIAAPRVRLPNGRRALDWAVVSSKDRTWSTGGLLSYFAYSQYAYNPGGATIIRRDFWRDFQWNENLFWNEHEDVELCRRIQAAGHPILLAKSGLITSEDRWIDQNPIIPYFEQAEVLYGYPVSEQRLVFLQNKVK